MFRKALCRSHSKLSIHKTVPQDNPLECAHNLTKQILLQVYRSNEMLFVCTGLMVNLLEGMDSAGQLCNTVWEEHCNVNECEMDVRRAHFVDRTLPRGIKGDLEIMFLVTAFA